MRGARYVMLMEEGATSTAIADYLYETSIGHIGLDPSEALKHGARRAADSIIAARPYFDLQ